MAYKKFTKKPDNSHIVTLPVKREWSEYQKAIFKDIAVGNGNTVVIARAGSAKTSSIVEGSKYIPKGKKTLFCAFNKSIQEELKGKLGSYVECLTLHSLGLRGIKQRFGNVTIDNYKCQNIVTDLIGNSKQNYDLIENVCKAIDFCKATLTDTPAKIAEIIDIYGLDYCEVESEKFIQYVVQGMRRCKDQTNIIDFNDMCWFPFVYNINVGKYDLVFIDEAQDLNKAQIELAFSAVKSDGRVIIVMDPRQAIYSWRGADSRVLENFKVRFNPKELTLPISYRCPKSVINLAQTIVPDILAFDKSPEGTIIKLDLADLPKFAKPGSYVLSRINAPLIKHAMSFLKKGIPANILGRDIGEGLIYLIKKSKKKTVPELISWLVTWQKEEIARITAKYPKANVDVIADKAECINYLCADASSVEEVKLNIKNLFADKNEKSIVLFSSIHKIKGKESDTVFVLEDTLRFSSEEEDNIAYIAWTRSKNTLYRVKKAWVSAKTEEEMDQLWDRARPPIQ